jgi:hypothetical protein
LNVLVWTSSFLPSSKALVGENSMMSPAQVHLS